MPTYEYACQSCGHRFETFQSIKAEPLTDCPSCEAARLRRVVGSGAGIIFKGSGFYQTDYRKQSGSGETSNESSTEKKSDKSDNKAKPEPASSAKSGNGAVSSASKD